MTNFYQLSRLKFSMNESIKAQYMYANDCGNSTFGASEEWKTTTLMPRFTIWIDKNHAISISTHGEAFHQGFFDIAAISARACTHE
jgi:hypothetical protein